MASKAVKAALISIIALLALGVAGVAVSCLYNPFAWSQPHVAQTSSPITLEDAREGCPIPLPDSAKNIQYAVYQEWQAYEVCVRFEAPAADCLEHVAKVVEERREEFPGEKTPIQFRPIDGSPDKIRVGPPLNAQWFDIERITKGVTVGEGGPRHGQIWVDEERGVFYFYVSD